MPNRHLIDPSEYGPKRTTLPEEAPGWVLPYQEHLDKYSRSQGKLPLGLRVQFDDVMPGPVLGVPRPGDQDGVVICPAVVRLSLRVRRSLYLNQHHAGIGAYVLFRQVAYLEFWQKNPVRFPIRWRQNPERWMGRAHRRASDLLWIWCDNHGLKAPED